MPYMKDGKRDYRREYDKYHAKPEQKKNRSQRNSARALVAKAKGEVAIKGKDVAHGKAISKGGTNSLSNLYAQSPSGNRSFSRNGDGSMKSEKSKRESRGKKTS